MTFGDCDFVTQPSVICFSIKPVLVTNITKFLSYVVKNKFIYLQIEFSFRVSNCNSKKKIFDLNLEIQVVISVTP